MICTITTRHPSISTYIYGRGLAAYAADPVCSCSGRRFDAFAYAEVFFRQARPSVPGSPILLAVDHGVRQHGVYKRGLNWCMW